MSSLRHGKTKTKTWYAWVNMRIRCFNKNGSNYKHYGGRGITVCDRWMKFENFYADMGDKPVGMSLDRINNDGNYEPGNCRWSTGSTQQNNKRNNHLLFLNGEMRTLAQWSEEFDIDRRVVLYRIRSGWKAKDALTLPVGASLYQNKKCTSRFIVYGGKEKTVTEWANETGINRSTIFKRLKNGWSSKEVLEIPVATNA